MAKFSRSASIWLVALSVFFLGGLTIWTYSPATPIIPSSNPLDIAKIEARLQTSEKSIDFFEVGREEYGSVLALFRDGTVDQHPARWRSLGDIRINYADGRSCSIWVFHGKGNRGAYRIGKTYYRGASTELF